MQSLFFITGSLFMYNRLQRSGFTILPLARHKVTNYATIFLSGLALGLLGNSIACAFVGNNKDLLYLEANKRDILDGKKSLERQL